MLDQWAVKHSNCHLNKNLVKHKNVYISTLLSARGCENFFSLCAYTRQDLSQGHMMMYDAGYLAIFSVLILILYICGTAACGTTGDFFCSHSFLGGIYIVQDSQAPLLKSLEYEK